MSRPFGGLLKLVSPIASQWCAIECSAIHRYHVVAAFSIYRRNNSQYQTPPRRQVHLYPGTPGRTVWAQSPQTNRPFLWAIIDLKSVPAMQYRQRMVRILSVGNERSCTAREKRRHAGFQNLAQAYPLRKQKVWGCRVGIGSKPLARVRRAHRRPGRSDWVSRYGNP